MHWENPLLPSPMVFTALYRPTRNRYQRFIGVLCADAGISIGRRRNLW